MLGMERPDKDLYLTADVLRKRTEFKILPNVIINGYPYKLKMNQLGLTWDKSTNLYINRSRKEVARLHNSKITDEYWMQFIIDVAASRDISIGEAKQLFRRADEI